MADAGYDSGANHRFGREALGVDSLIPAKRRRSAKVVATTPYRQATVRRLGEPGEGEARRTSRQRWKAATVMPVAKRRWGESLSARLDPTQEAQALLRGVVHNLNRLVRLGSSARTFRQSNRIEQSFNRLKPFRRLAKHSDRCILPFRDFVHLAAAMIRLS